MRKHNVHKHKLTASQQPYHCEMYKTTAIHGKSKHQNSRVNPSLYRTHLLLLHARRPGSLVLPLLVLRRMTVRIRMRRLRRHTTSHHSAVTERTNRTHRTASDTTAWMIGSLRPHMLSTTLLLL